MGEPVRRTLLFAAIAAGCSGPGPEAPSCAEGAVVSVAAPVGAWLVREVRISLPAPAAAELHVDGVSVAAYPAAQVHHLPVYGRPGAVREVRVALTCEGPDGSVGPIAVDVGEAPAPWPVLEVLADLPDAREPGLTFVDVGQASGQSWVAAVEPDGTPVWAWSSPHGKVLRARHEPDGTVWVVTAGGILHLDLLGGVLGWWDAADRADEAAVPVAVGAFHHDVVPIPGGFVALDDQVTAVEAYPISEALPNGPMAPADLIDPVVVDVASDGTLRRRWPLAERLDAQRIGWQALQADRAGYDWGHANAVAVDPRDGGIVVSLRHQDALVKLDAETGDVRWILANPDGWRSPWAELRLRPVGEVTWPYHQHGPMVTANADGTLDIAVFDNGNFDRTTPYSGDDDRRAYYSRIVVYRVDEAAGTVSERWSAHRTTTGRLYSGAFGDADRLPLTGNHLGVWGMLYGEGGVRNVDRGRGARSARLVELAPSGEVAWDLSIWGPAEAAPEGWQAHGAMRIPSLYPR